MNPVWVQQQPLLDVDYFLPREVLADDPFTEPVEAPVPFPLGVRVSNHGFGTAGNLHITSGQPQIVENKQGLLIAFRLLGTTVNGQPVQPTLNASFGIIPPGGCGVADWEMVTTLSGRFVAFSAEYTHAPDLGGEMTSLIRASSASELVREMLVDLPGRDAVRDFLADTDGDPENLPDRIFESSCGDLPVNTVSGGTSGNPTATNPDVVLTTAVLPGWTYTRVPDPASGLVPLAEVLRSDGKRLRTENFWISREQDERIKTLYHHFANLIDFDSTGIYTLRYQRPAADSSPPATTILFQEPFHGTGPTYITPATQILFAATDDISGVGSIEYRLDGGDFQPAFPFNVTAPGPHLIVFRSTDRSGNREADQSAAVVVDPDPPALAPISPSPSSFTPAAPEGTPAARLTRVAVAATDAVPDLTGVLEIARGAGPDFGALPAVRSIPFALRSGVPAELAWDGRNASGIFVPEGTYSLRAGVSDPLGNRSEALATVLVREFVAQAPAAGTAEADQKVPDLRGGRLVWQDNRGGDWNVFTLDLAGGAPVDLTPGQPADQERPRTDGRYVVWQDRRSGNWDIFLYDLQAGTTMPFATEVADQENPVVAAPWVVWQENRGGQYDLVARNIDTGESVELSGGDPGSHDQIRPAISGTTVAFEDYRFGLGEIFTYDLLARQERRLTDNIDNQTRPSIDGSTVVWVDQRHANRDLYMFDLGSGAERRLTFTPTDETDPSVRSGLVVYVDFSAGPGDPAIAALSIVTRRSLRLTSDLARQEEPVGDGGRVAWQDDRTGRWQIMLADVALDALPVEAGVGPGFNLVGVTDAEAASHPDAFSLLASWNAAAGIGEIQKFDPAADRMRTARLDPASGLPAGDAFAVAAGDALIARAAASGALGLAAPSGCPGVVLRPGANYVSLACVPPGYTAQDLLQAFGMTRVTSIQRYDAGDGRWKTLAVDAGRLAGEAFPIIAGEGYVMHALEGAGPVSP